MFSFEYDFFPRLAPDLDGEARDEALYDFFNVAASFLADLYHNGQMIRQPWDFTEAGDTVRLRCIAPEADSLDSRHYNIYCRDSLDKLLSVSSRSPEYRMLGETLWSPAFCSCSDPSFYILFTTFIAEASPVDCGDCNLPVPLYRLRLPDNEPNNAGILRWEAAYRACDTLWIGSGVGERFGYRQMSRADSELTKEGLDLCGRLAAITGRPCYYFLHRYYSTPKPLCPRCGRSWKLEEKLHDFYTHKCDNCLLLSASSISR